MIQKRTREELYDKFRQGAIPSGADFADFIRSQLNLLDDGIEISEDVDDPVCFRAHGDEANILDFADTDGDKRWRISGYAEDGSTEGLNIKADDQSKLFIGRETGNVGISTDQPDAKLHIIQTSAMDALRIDDIGNDETPLVVTSDGMVGIGTDSPAAKLHLSHSGSGDILRVDDTDSDTTPFIIDDTGNTGIGYSDPQAKLTVAGGVAIGTNNNPGSNNLYVAGNVEVAGTVVFSGGEGVGGIEINAPLTSKTKELTVKDNLNIIADSNQDGSDGNLSVAGDTTLGTYHKVYELQNVVTVNGRIRSGGDNQSGEEQYELELNEILTVNRDPYAPQAVLAGNLTVSGSATLGDTQSDHVYLNGKISSNMGDVTIEDNLTVTGSATLGDTQSEHVYLNGEVSSNVGDVIINDNLQVTGTTTLGDAQSDSIYLNGKVSSNMGDVTIEDNLTVTGSVTLGDTQSEHVYLNGEVSSNVGDVIINDNLQVTGTTTFGDDQSDSIYLNGKVSSNVGDVTIEDNLTVTGSTTLGDGISDNIYLNGTVSSNTGSVTISDSVTISHDLNVNGSLIFDTSSIKVGGIVTAVDNLDDGVITTEGAVKRYVDGLIADVNSRIATVDGKIPSFYRDIRYQRVPGKTNAGGWGSGHLGSYDFYPPSGFNMSQLLHVAASPMYIPFSGDVNKDDTLSCYAEILSDRIRCYCGNSEQRDYSTVALYALWGR